MKIAIVLNTSWNIYNFRMGLIKSLQAAGHEVIAIAPHDEFTDRLVEAGCTYYNVKMDSRGANPLKDMLLTFELLGIYRKAKPDIIFQFTIKPNIYGTFAAYLAKIPVVNNVCGLGTIFLKDDLVSKVAINLYKLAFKYPRKVFFQNADDCSLFLERGLIDEHKAEIIPGSGIDINKFIPLAKNTTLADPPVFLMISRLIIDKGVREYIQAIRKLKAQKVNARFQILGAMDPQHRRGIPTAEIEGWIAEGLIEYMGTTDDVKPYIQAADCIVLPSYREGTPRTLLEASAMERPIIATNVAGCNNVVHDYYNGLLCKIKDADDLAHKIKEMASLPADMRMKMGKNGRELVLERFDERLVVNKYMGMIPAKTAVAESFQLA